MEEVDAANLYDRVETLLSITDSTVPHYTNCGSPSCEEAFDSLFDTLATTTTVKFGAPEEDSNLESGPQQVGLADDAELDELRKELAYAKRLKLKGQLKRVRLLENIANQYSHASTARTSNS